MVTVNWLMQEEIDPVTGLGLQILDHVLLGTPASPLRKALIESGLGEDLSGIGMETELQQFFFSIGLKGVAREEEEQVVELVLQTLESLAGEGIDRETVTAALNTSEFRLRENNTGSYPRGLALMLRALTTWLYDRDPFAPLSYAEPLAEVTRRAESRRLVRAADQAPPAGQQPPHHALPARRRGAGPEGGAGGRRSG